jgi:alpha-N-arabinofuranosidase
MKSAWFMNELVEKNIAIMDKYDPKGLVDLIVDEWGGWYAVEPGTNPGFLYQQNTMRDAMIAGMTLNIFNNHARRVKMANLAQAVNVLQAVILTEGKNMILTPTYHVMEMYKVHQDAKLIPISLQSTDFEFNQEKIPAVSVSASQDKQGRTHISLVNIDPKKNNKVRVDLGSVKAAKISGRILTAQNLRDYNSFKKPTTIKPVVYNKAKVVNGAIEVDIPAFSVIVLELI